MNIFVNARFLTQPVSGVQRYAIECSRQIKRLYPSTIFLAPQHTLHKDIANELGVKTIGINQGHLWEQADLPLYLSTKGCPPLLSLANTAPLLYSNNYITIHDLAFHHHPEWNAALFAAWYNYLIPRLAKKAKYIFTVSDTIKNEIIQSYHRPANKIAVTFNGLAQNILRYNTHGLVKEKIILSVGSFNKRKNHHHLIEAFLASGLKDEYRLIIIGDKNKVFSETGLNDAVIAGNNIELLQGVSDEILMSVYAKAEIIVSLSVYEGFGIPVLEGLYFGCKALCADIPVYRELYDKYAYFCDPADINNITSSLKIVAASENKINEIGLLLDKYDYKKSAKAIIRYIVADNSQYA